MILGEHYTLIDPQQQRFIWQSEVHHVENVLCFGSAEVAIAIDTTMTGLQTSKNLSSMQLRTVKNHCWNQSVGSSLHSQEKYVKTVCIQRKHCQCRPAYLRANCNQGTSLELCDICCCPCWNRWQTLFSGPLLGKDQILMNVGRWGPLCRSCNGFIFSVFLIVHWVLISGALGLAVAERNCLSLAAFSWAAFKNLGCLPIINRTNSITIENI